MLSRASRARLHTQRSYQSRGPRDARQIQRCTTFDARHIEVITDTISAVDLEGWYMGYVTLSLVLDR